MPRLKEWRWQRWAEWVANQVVIDEPELIAFDTETTGTEFYDEPFAATVTWRGRDGSLRSGYFDLESEGRESRAQLLGDTLRRVGRVVAHNLKFDAQKAILAGILTRDDIDRIELHDTQTMYVLLDENGRKGLKHLAVHVLKYDDTITVPYKSGKKKGQPRQVSKEKYQLDEARRKLKLKKEDGYHLLPRRVLVPYALRDTEFTLRLYEALWPRLQAKDDPKLIEWYRTSMELKKALLDMEADGLGLDLDYLRQAHSEWGVKTMELWDRVVALTGNPELNLNAPHQIKDEFAKRGVFLDDTQADTLAGVEDELAQAIIEYREAQKIHTTYLGNLLKIQRDGIAHPNFNDDAAKTGRMSSSSAKE